MGCSPVEALKILSWRELPTRKSWVNMSTSEPLQQQGPIRRSMVMDPLTGGEPAEPDAEPEGAPRRFVDSDDTWTCEMSMSFDVDGTHWSWYIILTGVSHVCYSKGACLRCTQSGVLFRILMFVQTWILPMGLGIGRQTGMESHPRVLNQLLPPSTPCLEWRLIS